MNREERPISYWLPWQVPADGTVNSLSAANGQSPVNKLADLINTRNWQSKSEACHTYDEFCNALSMLHKEKTFVPPICLT